MNHRTATPAVNVTIRCPRDLVRAIDEIAESESTRLGLPVDRSALVRRALAQALAAGTLTPGDAPRPLGLADAPGPSI